MNAPDPRTQSRILAIHSEPDSPAQAPAWQATQVQLANILLPLPRSLAEDVLDALRAIRYGDALTLSQRRALATPLLEVLTATVADAPPAPAQLVPRASEAG